MRQNPKKGRPERQGGLERDPAVDGVVEGLEERTPGDSGGSEAKRAQVETPAASELDLGDEKH